MGAPSSSILAEIFLQHIEHTHLTYLTQKHKLINYFRYVDDILLIYDSHHRDIHSILDDFNAMPPNLHFAGKTEQNSALNYLDVTTYKTPTNIKISIYRKPNFTDTHSLYILSPYTTQICSDQILIQQAEILPPTQRSTLTRRKYHPQHPLQ
jgi:hypothetical protein